jgi:tripartite-type tricarboxylate transporter receptor subunit TctC
MKTLLSLSLLALATLSQAQSFPQKPITLIVPNPPGGVVDTSARLISDALAKQLGQAVIVDNKGGASGNIAYGQVARAAKDGHTLLISYSAYHLANPALFAKLPWAQSDFVPVALLTAATNVIAVHPAVPVDNLKSFISYLQTNPGKINYASQGNGSLSHLGSALFEQQTQSQMQHVPYKGSGDAIKDVLSGQVQLFMTTPPSVLGHIQAGKLKALAVTAGKRHPSLPNVPTTSEAGLAGFELEAWVGLFAPAGTPADVVNKLSAEVKRALEQPEQVQRAAGAGIEIRYLPPEALAAKVSKETAIWAKTIQTAKITAE